MTALVLLGQVLAVNAAESAPAPDKTTPKEAPKPEAKPRKLKRVMPVKSFGGY